MKRFSNEDQGMLMSQGWTINPAKDIATSPNWRKSEYVFKILISGDGYQYVAFIQKGDALIKMDYFSTVLSAKGYIHLFFEQEVNAGRI